MTTSKGAMAASKAATEASKEALEATSPTTKAAIRAWAEDTSSDRPQATREGAAGAAGAHRISILTADR